MSYTIDFFRGRLPRESNFIRFATFVAFFPQLVAGPIERAGQLLPQFARRPSITPSDVSEGMSLFLIGLFKKIAIANYLSLYVDRVYGQPESFGSPALLMATFAFAWQIYFDFSGYTDMARGVARMMGFRLMLNFRHPYIATGLGDFWARWHISLSTWFRDYVYIPLGGSRNGPWRTYANLMLTFVISGLWHGAAWTFLVWGGLHAAGVLATRALERSDAYRERFPAWCKRTIVFGFVCFAWIFFRAESMPHALEILGRIATGPWTNPQFPILPLVLVIAVWIYQYACESSFRRRLHPAPFRLAMAVGMILWICFFSSGGGEFIYFQF